MRIRTKLLAHAILLILVSVTVPSIIIGWMAIDRSKTALTLEAKEQLVAMKQIQKERLDQYFDVLTNKLVAFSNNHSVITAMQQFKSGYAAYQAELANNPVKRYKRATVDNYLKDFGIRYEQENPGEYIQPEQLVNAFNEVSFALQHQYIINNPYKLRDKHKLDASKETNSYSVVHEKFHPMFREFQQRFGIYDILLVDINTSEVLYSVFKELDFTAYLNKGPLSNTPIAAVFNALQQNNTDRDYVNMVDFHSYLPSYNKQVAFIGTPIYQDNKKTGALIFQIAHEELEKILSFSENWDEVDLGNTGETFIVGSDHYIKSTNRLFLENPEAYLAEIQSTDIDPKIVDWMRAKQTNVGLQKIEMPAVEAALSGKSGYQVLHDYRGVETLVAFEPLKIHGVTWALISKIDAQEAFIPISQLSNNIVYSCLLIILIMLCISFYISTRLSATISTPIERLCEIIRSLAESQDLTQRIEIHSYQELVEIAEAINFLITEFQRTCQVTVESTDELQKMAQDILECQKLPEVEQQKKFKQHGETINEMSQKLRSLARQFKIFEYEADRKSEW